VRWPVHNAKQQIIDQFGDAIARLYAAGEMGSSFGHLYMSGSNITECFVNGRIAGHEVMMLQPWDTAGAKERKTLREMALAK
jgi:succinate dehydrogenase/fumarate reductase flavoprotein subunit